MILAVFDLETTGLDRSKDQIIQFSGLHIDTNTHKIIKELNFYIQPIGSYKISIGAYFKHHITEDFLKDKPYLKEVAPQIVDFFNKIDGILTYNGLGFDIPFIKIELSKYGYNLDFMNIPCYDAFLEEKRRNGISLDNTYKRYKGKTMEEAGLNKHNAMSDIKATYSIFIAQQKNQKYGPEELFGEDNVITLQEVDGELLPCLNIGQYKGAPLKLIAEQNQNYLKWCISDKCNFMDSTKQFIKRYIQ